MAFKRPHLLLSFVGRITDGIKHQEVRKSTFQGINDLIEFLFVLGRLGNDKGLFDPAQGSHIRFVLNHVGRGFTVTH